MLKHLAEQMSRSLSVQSLIKLVGEDKLRAELDKNSYTYVEIQQYSGGRLYVDVGIKFTTTANPIEWLIFNSSTAYWMIYSAVSDHIDLQILATIILDTKDKYGITIDDRHGYDEDDAISVANAYILSVKDNEKLYGSSTPIEWAEALWRLIKHKKMKHVIGWFQTCRPAIDIQDNTGASIFMKHWSSFVSVKDFDVEKSDRG